MTLLFIDGFDAQDALTKWSPGSATGIVADYTTYPARYGTGYALATSNASSYSLFSKSITPSAKAIVGFAYRAAVRPGEILSFFADSGGIEHVRISVTSTGAVTIGRVNTVLATSAAGVIPADGWVYIEVSATVADSGGTADVRVNGVSVVSTTGDTKNGGSSTNIDVIRITARNVSGAAFDDLYICNALGSINNAFLGEVRVQTLMPNADGSVSGLSPHGSASHFDNVNDVPSDPARYNYSDTPGARDLYGIEDVLGGTIAVLAVQMNSLARKTDSGARSIRNLLKSGATITASADKVLTATASIYVTAYEVNPTTAAPWAVSDIAALEVGIEVV